VIGVSVVEKVPPSLEYSILQVPVPPPLSVTPVSVKVLPTHTVVAAGDCVAVGANGSATTVQVYVVIGETHPRPVQLFLIRMVLDPTVAVMGVRVVENAAKLLEYSMLHVPVPPPLSVTPVSVRVAPAQTVVIAGDCVAVGADGSGTTVTLRQLSAHFPVTAPQVGEPVGVTKQA
jgi:hypothetical protein